MTNDNLFQNLITMMPAVDTILSKCTDVPCNNKYCLVSCLASNI